MPRTLFYEDKLDIPRIYRSTFYQIALWAWVTAVSRNGKDKKEGILSFIDYFHQDEEDYDVIRAIYQRKNKEYVETIGRDEFATVKNCVVRKAWALHNEGNSYAHIGRELGVSKTTAWRLVRRIKEENDGER